MRLRLRVEVVLGGCNKGGETEEVRVTGAENDKDLETEMLDVI